MWHNIQSLPFLHSSEIAANECFIFVSVCVFTLNWNPSILWLCVCVFCSYLYRYHSHFVMSYLSHCGHHSLSMLNGWTVFHRSHYWAEWYEMGVQNMHKITTNKTNEFLNSQKKRNNQGVMAFRLFEIVKLKIYFHQLIKEVRFYQTCSPSQTARRIQNINHRQHKSDQIHDSTSCVFLLLLFF